VIASLIETCKFLESSHTATSPIITVSSAPPPFDAAHLRALERGVPHVSPAPALPAQCVDRIATAFNPRQGELRLLAARLGAPPTSAARRK